VLLLLAFAATASALQQVTCNRFTLPGSIDTYKGPAPNRVVRWMSVAK